MPLYHLGSTDYAKIRKSEERSGYRAVAGSFLTFPDDQCLVKRMNIIVSSNSMDMATPRMIGL